MLDLILTVAPAETPVSLTEAKAHLNVDSDDFDLLIGGLVAAATEQLDGYTGLLGRCLATQTWTLHLAGFPSGSIPLPMPPVQSVDSITYLDAAGVTQTLSTSQYWTHQGRAPVIDLVAGASWPATASHRRAVSIRFVAGYGAAADVPAPIKAAILLMVGHLYAHREAVSGDVATAVPLGVEALLAPYRRVGL